MSFSLNGLHLFLLVVAKLMDKLFGSASIKFLANGFVGLCKLIWKEAFKEPTHKGLIIEAPITVQRVLHKLCAWAQGVQALFLSFLSGAGIFLAFVQVGLCHQSIKLAKSLQSN